GDRGGSVPGARHRTQRHARADRAAVVPAHAGLRRPARRTGLGRDRLTGGHAAQAARTAPREAGRGRAVGQRSAAARGETGRRHLPATGGRRAWPGHDAESLAGARHAARAAVQRAGFGDLALAAGRSELGAGRGPFRPGRWPRAAQNWALAAGRTELGAGRGSFRPGRWPRAVQNSACWAEARKLARSTPDSVPASTGSIGHPASSRASMTAGPFALSSTRLLPTTEHSLPAATAPGCSASARSRPSGRSASPYRWVWSTTRHGARSTPSGQSGMACARWWAALSSLCRRSGVEYAHHALTFLSWRYRSTAIPASAIARSIRRIGPCSPLASHVEASAPCSCSLLSPRCTAQIPTLT